MLGSFTHVAVRHEVALIATSCASPVMSASMDRGNTR